MAQVILFGGGDGGGIRIGPNGVHPIPPFDPALLAHLKGLSALVRAGPYLPGKTDRREFLSLVNKIANLAVGQVEAQVGALDADNALVFQDDDGGFTCGSTGKPPIPLPWPPGSLPDVGDLVARQVMDPDLVKFIRTGAEHGLSLSDLLADPKKAAQKIGTKLPERTAGALALLSPAHLDRTKDPVDREVLAFFHKVVADERYIDQFTTQPFQVARALGVTLSPDAVDKIITSGSGLFDPGSVMNPVAVAVAVAIVIMLVDDVATLDVQRIRDVSNAHKL